uniref:Transmembrane protein n=1 Tax=Echinococcus granulosus TaxID=6210 RepID=U6FU16_ECHGR|nr:hypothetical protein EgrG_002001700 [Echinococcus granulosus]
MPGKGRDLMAAIQTRQVEHLQTLLPVPAFQKTTPNSDQQHPNAKATTPRLSHNKYTPNVSSHRRAIPRTWKTRSPTLRVTAKGSKVRFHGTNRLNNVFYIYTQTTYKTLVNFFHSSTVISGLNRRSNVATGGILLLLLHGLILWDLQAHANQLMDLIGVSFRIFQSEARGEQSSAEEHVD